MEVTPATDTAEVVKLKSSGSTRKKKKSASLNGTPFPEAVESREQLLSSATVTPPDSLAMASEDETKRLKRKKSHRTSHSHSHSSSSTTAAAPSLQLGGAGADAVPTPSVVVPAVPEDANHVNGKSPSRSPRDQTQAVNGDHHEEKERAREERRLLRSVSRDSAVPSRRRSEDKTPSHEEQQQQQQQQRVPPPAITIPPRKRKDSVDKNKPISPHPLRNSFTQEDMPDHDNDNETDVLSELRMSSPKKNSLSGIQEVSHENVSQIEDEAEPQALFNKLQISGNLFM